MRPVYNNLTKLPEGDEQIINKYFVKCKDKCDTESIIKIQGIYMCTIFFKKSYHNLHFYKLKYLVIDPIFNKLRIYNNYNGLVSDLRCKHNKAMFTYDLNKFINCSTNKWKKNRLRFKIVKCNRILYNIRSENIDTDIKFTNICNFASNHESKIRKLKEIIYNVLD